MIIEHPDLLPDPSADGLELAVLPDLVSVDTAAIDIIAGATQQIDVALSAYFETDDLAADEDVIRDDHALHDEQPLVPPPARDLAVGITEGLPT